MSVKLIAAIALVAMAAPAAAATSSADLDALATTLEQNAAPSSTLNSKLLALLREPAKTIEGRTLPTTAAQYTTSIETAWKLMPAGFIPQIWQHYAAAAGGVNCSAMLAYWETGLPASGLRFETFAWGKGNCASVSSAVIARAWAWKLRQVGR